VESGFDGGKKIKGRKRHIVVDTIGCVIQVVVHAAHIYDGKAARRVLQALFKSGRKLQKMWADMGDRGKAFAAWVKAQFGCDFEVVNRKAGPRVFESYHGAGWSKEPSPG
jgi:putative transposase